MARVDLTWRHVCDLPLPHERIEIMTKSESKFNDFDKETPWALAAHGQTDMSGSSIKEDEYEGGPERTLAISALAGIIGFAAASAYNKRQLGEQNG